MNEAYLTDDVSLRKNDFFIHLAHHMSVFWVVCAEFRKDKKSKIDVQHENSPRTWRSLAAYPYLKNLDTNRPLTDEDLWLDQLPGIAGLNSAEFPKAKDERATYLRSVVDEANELNAEIVFWDLSTGIATATKNKTGSSKRNADPCYIYWDELKDVVTRTNGVTCVYQHGRRASWESIYSEYESALGYAIRFKDDQPLVKTIGRAKAIFITHPSQADIMERVSETVGLYVPGTTVAARQNVAASGQLAVDNK